MRDIDEEHVMIAEGGWHFFAMRPASGHRASITTSPMAVCADRRGKEVATHARAVPQYQFGVPPEGADCSRRAGAPLQVPSAPDSAPLPPPPPHLSSTPPLS